MTSEEAQKMFPNISFGKILKEYNGIVKWAGVGEPRGNIIKKILMIKTLTEEEKIMLAFQLGITRKTINV